MGKIFKNLIVKFLILMTIVSYAKSEESGDIYIGALFGYGQSIHHNILYQFQYNGRDPYCPTEIDKEISQDYYFGLNLEYILFSKGHICNSINLSSSFNNSILVNKFSGQDFQQYIEDPADSKKTILVKSSTQWYEEMSFSFINVDLLYKFKLNYLINYGLSLGPFISIPITVISNEEYKIVEPTNTQFSVVDGIKYKDNYRTVVFYEGKINDVNPFYWGIKTNCFVEYEFFDLMKTTLEAGYSNPLSNFVKDSEWKIESYYVNLIISVKLN